MAKPESWRLDRSNYPFETLVSTRFQDLDTMGHINNVAMAGLFETGRVHFHHHIGRHPHDQGVRWLIAAVNLSYLREAHFPHDIAIFSGLGRIGNSSWTVLSAAFQEGHCVATCDTVVVTQGPDGRRHITDAVRDALAPFLVSGEYQLA